MVNTVNRLQCSAVLATGDTAGDISEDIMREGWEEESLLAGLSSFNASHSPGLSTTLSPTKKK